MRVLWTPRATSDLDDMVEHIGKDSPDSAVRVAERIYNQVMQLATTPHIGRGGDVPGTRELVFHHWPYIAVYRVTEDSIRVLRIRHASQLWP
jgi:toxin ParE1/3/4